MPVAYRGAAPIVTAVLGGEIDAGLPAYIPQVHSVKVIAVTSEHRVDFLPGVPTARETGLADMVDGNVHCAGRAGRRIAGDRRQD